MNSQLTEKLRTIIDQLVESIHILLNFNAGIEAVGNYAHCVSDLLYLFMVDDGDYAKEVALILPYLYNEGIITEKRLISWIEIFGKEMKSSKPLELLLDVMRTTDNEDIAYSILKTMNVFIAIFSGLYSRMEVGDE